MNKKFIALVCAALAVGLLIGVISFQNDLSGAHNSYSVEANLVQAYFHVFNASRDAPVNYDTLVSYVLIFNITNPSSQTLKIHRLQITLAKEGSKNGTSYSFGGGSVNYNREFADDNTANYWYPETSRIVGFSGTSGVTGLDVSIFEQGQGIFFARILFSLETVRVGGSTTIFENITLNSLGNQEYMYGDMFGPGHYFMFDENIGSSGWQSGRYT